MQSKYPKTDYPLQLITPRASFTIEDSGMNFQLHNCAAWRTVVYTDTETGKSYRVFAMAWEINGGSRIQKVLYINGVYQYVGKKSYLKDASDNALFNMVASSEKAVLYALNHAEGKVINLAFNDRNIASLTNDSDYHTFLDTLDKEAKRD